MAISVTPSAFIFFYFSFFLLCFLFLFLFLSLLPFSFLTQVQVSERDIRQRGQILRLDDQNGCVHWAAEIRPDLRVLQRSLLPSSLHPRTTTRELSFVNDDEGDEGREEEEGDEMRSDFVRDDDDLVNEEERVNEDEKGEEIDEGGRGTKKRKRDIIAEMEMCGDNRNIYDNTQAVEHFPSLLLFLIFFFFFLILDLVIIILIDVLIWICFSPHPP